MVVGGWEQGMAVFLVVFPAEALRLMTDGEADVNKTAARTGSLHSLTTRGHIMVTEAASHVSPCSSDPCGSHLGGHVHWLASWGQKVPLKSKPTS